MDEEPTLKLYWDTDLKNFLHARVLAMRPTSDPDVRIDPRLQSGFATGRDMTHALQTAFRAICVAYTLLL